MACKHTHPVSRWRQTHQRPQAACHVQACRLTCPCSAARQKLFKLATPALQCICAGDTQHCRATCAAAQSRLTRPCSAATQTLFALATFALYVALGHELTAPVVFTALALFGVLIAPLNSFPWVLQGVVEASVSLRRLCRCVPRVHAMVFQRMRTRFEVVWMCSTAPESCLPCGLIGCLSCVGACQLQPALQLAKHARLCASSCR